jgi:hypothetical protein
LVEAGEVWGGGIFRTVLCVQNNQVNVKEIMIGSASSGICTPYEGDAGMLIHINGKLTMGKSESSLLS